MPAESLIAVDGFLRTLADGSLVTDRNGAPCCCGGQPGGCCICVDTQAAPGAPCFYDYAADNAGVLCNSKPSCCCGQRMRVTMNRSGVYHATGGGAVVDVTLADTLVFESYLDIDKDGKCFGASVGVSWHSEYHRVRTKGGQETHTDIVNDDILVGMARYYPFTLRPFLLCRPEPVALSACMLFYSQTNNDPEKLFNPYSPGYFPGTWNQIFNDKGCTGQINFNDGYHKVVTNWTSSAACRSATLSASAVLANINDDTEEWTQTATLSGTVLDNKCCPPVLSTAFQPTGPVNPGTPGVGNPGGKAGGCAGCQDGGAGIGEEL